MTLPFSVLALSIVSRAVAQPDYDAVNEQWNGLSGLLEIANEEGVEIAIGDSIALDQLSPLDGVLLIYPRDEPPTSSLSAFMRAGGRVAVLDDFGEGDELLSVYRIARREGRAEAPELRANPNLPLARPLTRHALTDGVNTLVANHPATLSHPELEPLFAFEDPTSALVLAGAVGEGRLVAVSDPSVIINNMIEFRDNRRFAQNLVRYLGASGGRVYLAGPDTEWSGSFGDAGASGPFAALQTWLDDAAHADVAPALMMLASIALGLALVLAALFGLPRRSPYEDAAMFGRTPVSGGFIGRVAYFRRRPSDLIQPALVYKFELESELVRRLNLGGRTLLRDVVSSLREHGLPEADVQSTRGLLLALDSLREKQDHPPAPPKVTAARLREIVRTGDAVLERLNEENGTSPHDAAKP
jgi:hypothetical protein